jgi:hypothetical protein
MKSVAATVVTTIAAMVAATLIIQSRQEQAAVLEQVRAEHEDLMRHLSRMEQTLSIALNQDRVSALGQSHVPLDAGPVPHAGSPERSMAEQRTAGHEERVRAGNAFIDGAIVSGTWRQSDFKDFMAATRDLSGDERAQMLERVTKAINTDRMHIELTRRPNN